MVKLRNPWGQKEYQGKGRETDHAFWSRIPNSAERQRFFGAKSANIANDGVFLIEYDDFCEYFNEVHFCNLEERPKYESEPLYCDKKHGTIYTFTVKKDDDYIIELHQSGIRGEDLRKQEEGLSRGTIVFQN